ncbi:MAG TPA: thioredoxin [Clostridiales bacterium]|nr:thioredoxin [Clostridiales bacterium]
MAEITITKDNFDEVVAGAEVPVLVDFWAPWCGPCRMLAPIIEEIAKEAEGRYIVGKINVDEEEELADKFGIMNIPTLIVFRAGEPVKKSVGYKSKAEVLSLLGISPEAES